MLNGIKLNYNEDNSGQYNGNISKQYWGTPGNLGKYYTYTYDALSRLTSGIGTGTSNNETVSYDDLGNIQSLTRTGDAPAALTYNGYTGNQLNLVKNNGAAYRTYSSYDANGNALSDGQAHAISYNILNLPATVSVLNLYYVYDAGGRKLQRKIGSVPTDYIDGIQYENGVLSSVQTEEGRILNLTGTPNYEYALKDHLGNSRVIFESSTGGEQLPSRRMSITRLERILLLAPYRVQKIGIFTMARNYRTAGWNSTIMVQGSMIR